MSGGGLVSIFVDSLGLPLGLPTFVGGLSTFPPPVLGLAFLDFLLVSFSSGESSERDKVGVSGLLVTEGERLRARFLVTKLESAVGFLGLTLVTLGVGTSVLAVAEREEREMETSREVGLDLRCWNVPCIEDGDVVLA